MSVRFGGASLGCSVVLLLLAIAAASACRRPNARNLKRRIQKENYTYLFVDVVTAELYSAIRHDSDAVCAIACHHAAPSFFAPHLAERLANAHLVFIATDVLHLKQDL